MVKSIVYTSEYLRTNTETASIADAIHNALVGFGVEHRELKNIANYYWCRDYMPVLVSEDGIYAGYEFSPDYLVESVTYRKCITPQDQACQGVDVNVPLDMGIVFDGGNYVRCGDKVVMTDKIFMENPSWRASELLNHLEVVLKAEIVLLPWDMADFCGHSDGMVAYLGDDKILLNGCWEKKYKKFHARLLKILKGRFEHVEVLSLGCEKEDCNSWCYLNYLKLPGLILLPCLSENADCESDLTAMREFTRLFPDHIIKPIYALPLIKKGGALHCVTWEWYESR